MEHVTGMCPHCDFKTIRCDSAAGLFPLPAHPKFLGGRLSSHASSSQGRNTEGVNMVLKVKAVR